jgi:hypothetical protein
MFAYVKDSAVIDVMDWLPDNLLLEDGSMVMGFSGSDIDHQIEHGFFPLIDVTQGYVEGEHEKRNPTYTVKSNTVEVKYALTQIVKTKEQKAAEIEQALNAFAHEKDFDGIGEANALLKSSNTEWIKEGETFIRLWDETWQAFYNNEELPVLSWV